MYLTYSELEAIQQAINSHNEEFRPDVGSDIDLESKVSDSNGDVLGVIRFEPQEGYVFVPKGWDDASA